MPTDDVLIRAATASDCPSILKLFQELAEYEGMPNSVLINAKTLEEDGFGNLPFYKCLVAEDTSSQGNSGDLVGYVLYFYAFAWEGRALYMEDIYVSPTYRAKGIGTKLWAAIIKLGLGAGAQSCRFCVLDWNAPSIAFYQSRGALDVTASKGLHFVRMGSRASLEQLVARDIPEGSGEVAPNIRPALPAELPAVMEMKAQLSAETALNFDTQLTLEELTAGFTSSPATCRLLVAEGPKGELIGFCLYSFAYSTWRGRCFFFQDLFIKSEFRRSGLGSRLVKAAFEHCVSLGCCRCDFIVPVTNTTAMDFYQKLGAVDLTKSEGWLLMYMDKAAMENMVNSDGKK